VLSPCLFFSGRAFAGAWNQQSGEGQLITTSSWSSAGQIFDNDFNLVSLEGFSKTETRLYLEHGLTDWLTLVGNTGFQTLSFVDDSSQFNFTGLDDVELGAQYKLYTKTGLSTSVRFSYIIDSQLDNRVVDVLRGSDQVELRGLIGQSRETILGEFFYDAQFALRSDDFKGVDGIQSALTLGYKPTDRSLFLAQSFANFSDDEVVDDFPVQEQFQLNTQISGAYKYRPGRYVQFGVGQTLTGQNIVKERNVFIGLWGEY